MFHVGQLVPCVVLQVDDDKKESGKRKIWLSLRLSILYKDFSLDLLQEGMVNELKIIIFFIFLALSLSMSLAVFIFSLSCIQIYIFKH